MIQIKEIAINPSDNALAARAVAIPAHPSMPGISQDQLKEMLGRAMSDALFQARDLSSRMIEDVEAKLKGLQVPKAQVLAVEVDGIVRKISSSASPALGRMIVNAKLGLNTLLVGPAGAGKTIAAHQLAEGLGRQFGHICLTAGASETWLFGRQTPQGFVEGTFSKLYRNGGVFLADEMDAADPNLLLAINTALANGSLYNPILGEMIPRHPDFVFVGAANTLGRGGSSVYTGRSRLDAATLNRFVVLEVDYCPEIEKQVCPDDTLRERLQSARSKLRALKAEEIISTRNLDYVYRQVSAGIPLAEALASLTAGWPEELIDQCGLKEEAPKKSKAAKKPKLDELAEATKAKAEDFPF